MIFSLHRSPLTSALHTPSSLHAAILLSVLLASGRAQAAAGPEVIITDRPTTSSSSRTVGRLRFQLESGIAYTTDLQEGVRSHTVHTPLKARFAPIESLELHLETEGLAHDRVDTSAVGNQAQTGIGDLDIGGKLHLIDNYEIIPSFAVLMALTLPIGSDGFSGEQYILSPTLAGEWSIGSEWGITVNLGGTIPITNRSGQPDLVRYSLAVGRGWEPLTDRLGTFLELAAESPLQKHGHLVRLGGGATLLLTPRLQLDIFLAGGLSQAAPDLETGLGLSFKL